MMGNNISAISAELGHAERAARWACASTDDILTQAAKCAAGLCSGCEATDNICGEVYNAALQRLSELNTMLKEAWTSCGVKPHIEYCFTDPLGIVYERSGLLLIKTSYSIYTGIYERSPDGEHWWSEETNCAIVGAAAWMPAPRFERG